MGVIVKEYKSKIKAESDARQIELPKDYKKMSMKERRDVLHRDELKERAAMGLAREGLRKEDITGIIPILVSNYRVITGKCRRILRFLVFLLRCAFTAVRMVSLPAVLRTLGSDHQVSNCREK